MMRWILVLVVLVLGGIFAEPLHAQPVRASQFSLGAQYYQASDFQKAAEVFESLWNAEPSNQNYYAYYFNCLIQIESFKEADRVVEAMQKMDPANPVYQVDQAFLFRKQGKENKALGVYDDLVKKLPPSRPRILMLANAFRSKGEYDYGIKVFEKGRKMLKEDKAFALELAELYHSTGQKELMVGSYLDYLASAPQQLGYVQNILQTRLGEQDYEILRVALLAGIQARPDDLMLSELMIWFFVQQKDFEGAFLQARAIDRRMNESGRRILELAQAAVENKDHEAALPMYAYLIDKGERSPVYFDARYQYLETKYAALKAEEQPVATRWAALADDYRAYATAYPNQKNLLLIERTLARILAYELQDLKGAVQLLEDRIAKGGDRRTLAVLKLDLGDLYLFTEELWEAALKYGQVERDFPNDVLGQEAKFRNARLSFYKGEFEWAQAQLDVLKASTTQRTSNDALALSLLITDNLDLDTTIIPMRLFAAADLLKFRQDYAGAHAIFEQLMAEYPGHGLTDEVLMRQAEMDEKTGHYTAAAARYERVLADFGTDIWGDDALFALAVLAEQKFKDRDKAMQLYQDLLVKFPDSTFTFEARKRYRALRGDNLN